MPQDPLQSQQKGNQFRSFIRYDVIVRLLQLLHSIYWERERSVRVSGFWVGVGEGETFELGKQVGGEKGV